MLRSNHVSFLANLARENGLIKLVLIILAISNIYFGYSALKAVKFQKVIIVPTGYNDKVVIEGDRVNESYMIQLSTYVFKLALEYQPHTIKEHYTMIKTIMSPKSYRFYEDEFKKLVDDVELGQISSVFFINSMKHDPIKRVIKVSGVRRMYLEYDVVESTDLIYALKYEVQYGRVFITELGTWSDMEKFISNEEKKK